MVEYDAQHLGTPLVDDESAMLMSPDAAGETSTSFSGLYATGARADPTLDSTFDASVGRHLFLVPPPQPTAHEHAPLGLTQPGLVACLLYTSPSPRD